MYVTGRNETSLDGPPGWKGTGGFGVPEVERSVRRGRWDRTTRCSWTVQGRGLGNVSGKEVCPYVGKSRRVYTEGVTPEGVVGTKFDVMEVVQE